MEFQRRKKLLLTRGDQGGILEVDKTSLAWKKWEVFGHVQKVKGYFPVSKNSMSKDMEKESMVDQ